MPETKSFDCVEMKRRGAAPIQKTLEGKSQEERLAYWREQHERLLERREKVAASSSR